MTAVRSLLIGFVLLPYLWAANPLALVASPPKADEAFFESRIRPVLIKHCYSCHSAEGGEAKGGLTLDSRDAVRRGGDSGPALVPHKPEQSLLLQALHYDTLEMPPDGRLPEHVVKDFEHWIAGGAVDPRQSSGLSGGLMSPDIQPSTADHWAFHRVADPPIPNVNHRGWVVDTIDAFVLASLEAADLTPALPADRRTLVRRLYFDLIGLPPSPGEVATFLQDTSSQALPNLVDQLLQSPQFGIHWGRRWLDLARYADSNGGDFNATFHDAWKYRDYVIRSLNADKPYDLFLTEQIAGDLLPAANDQQRTDQLIATGFLMLGTKMLSERDKTKLTLDVVDEQVSTIGQALLGLTLGCARCHDHKFDPISINDYYSLAGIFMSTETLRGESQRYVSTWPKRELPTSSEHRAQVEAHAKKVSALQASLKSAKQAVDHHEKLLRDHQGSQRVVMADNSAARLTGNWTSSTNQPKFVGNDYLHDGNSEKGEKFAEFTLIPPVNGTYDVLVSYTPGNNRAPRVPISIRHAMGEIEVLLDQRPTPTIDGLFKSLGRFSFLTDMPAVITIATRDTEGYVLVDAVRLVGVDEDKVGRADSKSTASRPDSSKHEEELLAAQQHLETLEKAFKDLKAEMPPPLPTAMAVADAEECQDCAICIRGEHMNRGQTVPRGFIQAVSLEHVPHIATSQSGRLQLAAWLADPDHPLSSRVYVNRIWHHLLGRGIVASVDNFGIRGDRPTHPDLLDHLATSFIADGWSTKALIRRIVLSSTYQMSSQFDERSWEQDPDNTLLWRAHRRRLPAEAIRDAMLSISGQIDLSPGEAPVSGLGTLVTENTSEANKFFHSDLGSNKRSIYLPIIRAEVPEVLAVFDFADPDVVMGQRPETNVPAQSLFLLNNPFIARHAGHAAARIRASSYPDNSARVEAVFQLVLARSPTNQEHRDASAFLNAHALAEDAIEPLIRALLASTSFRMLE